MVNTMTLTPRTCALLRMCLGPREGGRVIAQVNTWIQSSGPEWTVKRIKAIRQAALHLLAGNSEEARDAYRTGGVDYYKSSLCPKGPWGYVVKTLVNSKDVMVIRRMNMALRLHTAIRLGKTSEAQWKKAVGSITDPIDTSSDSGWSESAALVAQWLGRPDAADDLDLLIEEMANRLEIETAKYFGFLQKKGVVGRYNTLKSKPNLRRLKAFTSTLGAKHRVSELPYAKAVASLLNECRIPWALEDLNPLAEFCQDLTSLGASDRNYGRIAFIQEAACKARVVAVPNAWVQWLFQPLHDHLDTLIRATPRSCVHDQNLAPVFIQQALSQDKKVWCFDLSSATDRFPRWVEEGVLRGLGQDAYARAVEDISTGKWICPHWENGHEPIEVSYAVGQPMGLYGSFPMFHLSHYLLLFFAESLVHPQVQPGDEETFLVLGDDVIIFDEDVAATYYCLMTAMGVEINLNKTIVSNKVAEFAGFLLVRYRTDRVTAWRPYKFNGPESRLRDKALSLVQSLGKRVDRLGPYWTQLRRQFQMTSALREPDLSPNPLFHEEQEGDTSPVLDLVRLQSLLNSQAHAQPDLQPAWLWGHVAQQGDVAQLLLGEEEPRSRVNPLDLLETPCEPDDDTRRKAHFDPLRDDPILAEYSWLFGNPDEI